MNEELLSRLDQLANKLGTTIDYLWPKLVRYELISNTMELAAWTSIFILLIYAAVSFSRIFIKDPEDTTSFALMCLAAMFALLILPAIVVTVPKVLVPEVAALKALTNIMK